MPAASSLLYRQKSRSHGAYRRVPQDEHADDSSGSEEDVVLFGETRTSSTSRVEAIELRRTDASAESDELHFASGDRYSVLRLSCFFFSILLCITFLIVFVIFIPCPLPPSSNWAATFPHLGEYRLDVVSPIRTRCHATPALGISSPLRLFDVSQDGADDVVFGFSASDDVNCASLGLGSPCTAGALALSGRNGRLIWQLSTDAVRYIRCGSLRVDASGQPQCLLVTVKGTLMVVEAKSGRRVWLQTQQMDSDPLIVRDMDNDGVKDIFVVSNGTDKITARLLSGKSGLPLYREQPISGSLSSAPVLYSSELVLLPLQDVLAAFPLSRFSSPSASVSWAGKNASRDGLLVLIPSRGSNLVSLVLVDITEDGVLDILVCESGPSRVVLLNGATLSPVWSQVFSQTISSAPAPARFRLGQLHLLIKLESVSEGHSLVLLDGQTGENIWSRRTDAFESSPPLSVHASPSDAFVLTLATRKEGSYSTTRSHVRARRSTETDCRVVVSTVIFDQTRLSAPSIIEQFEAVAAAEGCLVAASKVAIGDLGAGSPLDIVLATSRQSPSPELRISKQPLAASNSSLDWASPGVKNPQPLIKSPSAPDRLLFAPKPNQTWCGQLGNDGSALYH